MTSIVNVVFERPDAHRIVAKLREGDVTTDVIGWRPAQSAAGLLAAFEAAERDGYGECFWPEPTGQYWWMLRREDQRLEVAVMHSTGVQTGWQHVFRAADEMTYLQELVRAEMARQEF